MIDEYTQQALSTGLGAGVTAALFMSGAQFLTAVSAATTIALGLLTLRHAMREVTNRLVPNTPAPKASINPEMKNG